MASMVSFGVGGRGQCLPHGSASCGTFRRPLSPSYLSFLLLLVLVHGPFSRTLPLVMTSMLRVLPGFDMLFAPSLVCPDDALDSPSGESAQPPALFVLAYSEPNELSPAPLGSRDSET